jgi:signal peptidase II
VIDFIELSYNGYTWPIFNIADACIVIGIFIMIVELYKK